MDRYDEMKEQLFSETQKLHKKYKMSQNMAPDFFEPIMLEYLDKFEGIIDRAKGEITDSIKIGIAEKRSLRCSFCAYYRHSRQ